MAAKPNSFEEIANAPELPADFNGKVIKVVEYFRKGNDPKISFVPILIKTKVEAEECKWYISNATASCLQSHGKRDNCRMPIEPKEVHPFCYFYNYEVTKRYADWFFAEKGKFIFELRSLGKYHFILLFFCDDKNWAPFHNDLMLNNYSNILLDEEICSVTEITKKLLGCEEIPTNDDRYTKEEIKFMRAFIALTQAYRPEFRNERDYNNFVKHQIEEYNNATGYEISFDSFVLKACYYEFFRLSCLRSSKIFPTIYRYFFELNNLEGTFVRIALKEFQTVSFFNLIYRFLKMKDKRLVHFDEIILKEVREYMTMIGKMATLFGDRLPFAELLNFGFTAKSYNWKNLAGVAYLYTVEISHGIPFPKSHANVLDKLNKSIPNLDVKMNSASKDEKGIYEKFDEMVAVHRYMKNIPWKDYNLSYKYLNFFCAQLVKECFY